VHDLLCVGFGPANLAVAVALEEMWPKARVKFVEQAPGPMWQPNMLLDGADIQNNPLRDLVTPRNPRSRFTFVNYLHESGRLFKHLNLPGHFPLRKEYARYIQWVAQNVGADVDYGQRVTEVAVADRRGPAISARTASGRVYEARSVVVAPGRTPRIPEVFTGLSPTKVFHTSSYLPGLDGLDRGWAGTVVVVGASQSAIEVVLDLSTRFPAASVVNVMSGFGYRLKDTSPFSEEVYFPEFVGYYFGASPEGKARLREQLRPTNYSSADRDVIDMLYQRIYEDELDGTDRLSLSTNRKITGARLVGERVVLDVSERITGAMEEIVADRVVLATGYCDLGISEGDEKLPALLSGLRDVVHMDDRTGLIVGLDYRVEADDGLAPIYLNGLCESTHGYGDAGSFSLLALRSKAIVQSLRRNLNAAEFGADHPEEGASMTLTDADVNPIDELFREQMVPVPRRHPRIGSKGPLS